MPPDTQAHWPRLPLILMNPIPSRPSRRNDRPRPAGRPASQSRSPKIWRNLMNQRQGNTALTQEVVILKAVRSPTQRTTASVSDASGVPCPRVDPLPCGPPTAPRATTTALLGKGSSATGWNVAGCQPSPPAGTTATECSPLGGTAPQGGAHGPMTRSCCISRRAPTSAMNRGRWRIGRSGGGQEASSPCGVVTSSRGVSWPAPRPSPLPALGSMCVAWHSLSQPPCPNRAIH
mmetsp:Transcript_92051/g.159699  ORF Transcript_92051/g.159699 Transcript_92051/m.159699 type:complete len:233 (-) Transcript_92051:301-999(-)